MAGFALPKLRWLVVGAAAAGVWVAMTGPHPQPGAKTPSTLEFVRATPKAIEPPQARPSPITSSITRPDRPVWDAAFTRASVKLRAKPTTSSAILKKLEGGLPTKILQRAGKWSQVSVEGRTGWIHNDYLVDTNPGAPRPKEPIPTPKQEPIAISDPGLAEPKSGQFLSWLGGKRPIRDPQTSDCQCPYDLMLSGKACGDHSAYARSHGKVQCYK
jgi:hypothetical protein